MDQKLHAEYLRTVEERIQTLFQQGMGDSGTFWEGTGPGQIASDTCFVPILQAFRVAAGEDYAAGMPGPRALIMRWTSWLMPNPENGQPIFGYTEASWGMGGYGGRTFSRYGLSRGGQFSQGFGLLTDSDEKAVGVDFSGASGSDALVVVAGPAASTFETTRKGEKSKYSTVRFAGRLAGVLALSSSGKFPEVVADGDRLIIGGQTVKFDGKRLALAKNAGPWKSAARK